MSEKCVAAAIGAGGVSQTAAAKIMGISRAAFAKKRFDARDFTVREFFRLYVELDEDARKPMQDFIEEKLQS